MTLPVSASIALKQLQHTDHLVRAIFQGDGQERGGTIAGAFIKNVRAGKIEVLRLIGVGDVDRCAAEGGISSNVVMIRRPFVVV